MPLPHSHEDGRSRRLLPLLSCSAFMGGHALTPGLSFRLARTIAGPEQRFASRQPVAEPVAAVAAAFMAVSIRRKLRADWSRQTLNALLSLLSNLLAESVR
jgi:hypothetical protein